MNLAVIGSGGREHAICYKLKQSLKIKKLLCIPGNAGTKMLGENVDIDISNFDLIYKIIKEHKIDPTLGWNFAEVEEISENGLLIKVLKNNEKSNIFLKDINWAVKKDIFKS